MSTEPTPMRNRGAFLIALFALALAAVNVRAALIGVGARSLDDPDNYLPLAQSLAQGQGLRLAGRLTAYRPPLYPILLAPLVATVPATQLRPAVAALHLTLGALTVLLTAATARRWGLPPVAALLAAAIVALDPVLAVQARSVMTETPAAFLVALTLFASTWAGPFGGLATGLAFGLCALCRPSLLPAAGLATVAALALGPGSGQVRLARAGLIVLGTLLPLIPWAVRNQRTLGEPVWTTTHGGYTLALANNPTYYREVLDGPPGAVWTGINQARWQDQVARSVNGLSEPEADRRIAASAWRLARDQPGTFARASLARFLRFWGLAPSSSVYSWPIRVASAAWTVPLWWAMLLGLGSPWLRRWPGVLAPAMILALTVVHLFYWTDLRMRAPIVPAIALIAAGYVANRATKSRKGPLVPGT